MQDLVPLRLYSLVANHPPPPIDHLLERLSSVHARRTYEHIVLQYLSYIERDPLAANAQAIRTYKAEMLISCRPEAVALRLRIIRELYDEALAIGLVAANPALSVSPPSLGPAKATTLPTREAAAVWLQSCDALRESGRRDRALCLLALETEAVLEQVPVLTVQDFQQEGDGGALRSRAPGSAASSVVSLPTAVASAIEHYLAQREVADDSPLFGVPRLHVRELSGPVTVPQRGVRGSDSNRGLARIHPARPRSVPGSPYRLAHEPIGQRPMTSTARRRNALR